MTIPARTAWDDWVELVGYPWTRAPADAFGPLAATTHEP